MRKALRIIGRIILLILAMPVFDLGAYVWGSEHKGH
jgi:hypothetical protein